MAEEPEPGVRTQRSDRELAAALMRRQAGLGMRVAAVFLVLILGLPLVSYFRPEWSQAVVGGLSVLYDLSPGWVTALDLPLIPGAGTIR